MTDKKILVVDDDVIIRKALSEFFTLRGFDVLTAENGAIGFELFQKEQPDLIILDLVMPVMSGVECLEKIRSQNSSVQVIILTGYGTEEQLQRVQDLGVTNIIRKGIGFEDFLALIDQVIESKEFRMSSFPQDPANIKILIADDDAIIRTLLIEFLVSKGFHVLSAKDGDETCEVILKHKPTIVFLDLIMPKKDGKAVMKEIPESIAEQIKWVLITGHGYKTKEFKDIPTPFKVLQKPFSLETFESTITQLLQSFSVKI